jgi:putative DNA methylase
MSKPMQRCSSEVRTAIEEPSFPFEHLSDIAELESWRKEINRPIYHIHKWWAQRLGSVFRAILISAFSPPGTDVLAAFYTRRRPTKQVIFDPFMGSGTTIGEAIKLGFCAIGQDINPVSHFLVKNALAVHSRSKIIQEFEAMEAGLVAFGEDILHRHDWRPSAHNEVGANFPSWSFFPI